MIELTVNGEARRFDGDPETPLLYILRNDLGLKGAKYACGLEQCGACKVLIDGAALPSCKLPVREAEGRVVTTIEALSSGGALHAVQQALIEEQALQCGFCTPGFVMAAAALLAHIPRPTDEQIRNTLKYHLCRCGAYPRIFRAVKRAAGRLGDGAPVTVLDRPFAPEDSPERELPPSLERTPELDRWLRIDPEGTITLFAGKVEYGQGILTALAQIAAEELDVRFERMRVAPAQTGQTPDEGMTVGSMSLMTTGNAVRVAAAEARQYLLSLAFEELETRMENLSVFDGLISDAASGLSVSYWDLLGGKTFGRTVTGRVSLKSPGDYSLLGRSEKRLDLTAKVTGAPVFIHDLNLPGMLHGRVLRPPRPGEKLLHLDEKAALRHSGVVQVVQDGSFVGVIAETEAQAAAAVEKMREQAVWTEDHPLPGSEDPEGYLLGRPAQPFLIVDGTPVAGPVPEATRPDYAVQTLSADYFRPFQMHASLGPSAAVARMDSGHLTLWAHAQGVYPLRRVVANVLEMPEEDLTVHHVEGPGCYGHNGADDAALDAALLAKAHPGVPISLRWSRADEHRWEPYAPAMAAHLEGSLDADGNIVSWDHQVWTYPHLGRSRDAERVSGLLASWYLKDPFSPQVPEPGTWSHSGGYRNIDPLYHLPSKRIVKHFVADRPLRTSAMRGLGAFANVFAIESFMDELAHAAGKDPLAFRLDMLQDARAREVLLAAADAAEWEPRSGPRSDGTGWGIAFARYKNRAAYCAVVIELEADPDRGAIRLRRAFIAADAGQIVNPDGLANQLEGGLVQAASWTLREQVQYGPDGIRSMDWYSYPILQFNEAPEVRTVLLNRSGAPFLGSGEASSGPAGAAIANAVFDATGIRLRSLPLKLG